MREFAYRGIRFDRQRVAPGEILKQSDELLARHGTIRIRTVIAVARHDGLHIGSIHPKAVPSLCAPGLSDAAPLQDTVAQAPSCQPIADTQAGPAGPDDDSIENIAVISHLLR
ncbi:hypothetical protein ASD00_12105 [Ensifer sp. Root31]|nr:hypothetical protein ASD00_12105 [Ensifer sp. Root31]